MKKIFLKAITATAGIALLASGVATTAFAQSAATGIDITVNANASATGAGVNVNGKVTARESVVAKLISTAQTRADQEIARRVKALDALNTRVNAMAKLSSSDKASFSATIQAQITLMNNLQTQIASDAAANSTSSLKADIQSITKAYRIFALIIPQGAIEAAADRVLDVAGMLTTLSSQLQTRITAAQSAGNDMSASVTALADMNAKIADANTQANAAVSETTTLQPDNGDQTVMDSNKATLKDARSKIQAAQQDLTAARKDAGTIVKALLSVKVSATASTTANTNEQ